MALEFHAISQFFCVCGKYGKFICTGRRPPFVVGTEEEEERGAQLLERVLQQPNGYLFFSCKKQSQSSDGKCAIVFFFNVHNP